LNKIAPALFVVRPSSSCHYLISFISIVTLVVSLDLHTNSYRPFLPYGRLFASALCELSLIGLFKQLERRSTRERELRCGEYLLKDETSCVLQAATTPMLSRYTAIRVRGLLCFFLALSHHGASALLGSPQRKTRIPFALARSIRSLALLRMTPPPSDENFKQALAGGSKVSLLHKNGAKNGKHDPMQQQIQDLHRQLELREEQVQHVLNEKRQLQNDFVDYRLQQYKFQQDYERQIQELKIQEDEKQQKFSEKQQDLQQKLHARKDELDVTQQERQDIQEQLKKKVQDQLQWKERYESEKGARRLERDSTQQLLKSAYKESRKQHEKLEKALRGKQRQLNTLRQERENQEESIDKFQIERSSLRALLRRCRVIVGQRWKRLVAREEDP
jgi:hypothetical protein